MTLSAVERRLPYRSVWRIWLTDPEDTTETGTDRLQSDANGATCLVKACPEKLRRKLREDASATDTTIQVNGARDFEIDQQIEITAPDGARTIHTLTGVDPDGGELAFTPALSVDVERGALVRGYLGSWDMTEFGTPTLSAKTWGWQTTLPDDLEVEPGDRIMIEIELSGTGGGVAVFPQLGIVDDGRVDA